LHGWQLTARLLRQGKGPLQRKCNAVCNAIETIGKREDRKMGETSKHASSKHKRKEHRLTEKALARDGSARLAEAARKREAAEAAARKVAK
jgi:hypothetical protein